MNHTAGKVSEIVKNRFKVIVGKFFSELLAAALTEAH